MIKKHIITCTVIIALLVMAKVFAYHMPQATKSTSKEAQKTKNTTTTTTTKAKAPVSQMAQLNFAEETLPLGDAKVERKMKKVLAAYNYSRIQTNMLHRKAAEWFPIIEPILAAYGIPEDFKYVPLVESGLNSGTSPKGAAGFWQFMPGTARSYGLKVNSKVDERKNLRKSTIAAAKYIKELYSIFDSWTLVAAAYNVGDTHMKKQINRQNQDNYFKMRLNNETAGYVYKLISMKEIVEDPVRYGFRAPRELLAYNAKPFNVDATVE
ncbi:MAG: lytic transglycosylase domain-containing protein [Pedobacter sp.]|nr:MAG: lytic transglycosylase domain-containing protein [Pedobacter sp.]